MFNVLIEVILDFIAWIASIMTSIFYTPIYLLVQGAMDVDLSVYEGIFTSFLNTYVLPGLSFAKEVFLNFTGLPFGFFQFLVVLFLARLAFHITLLPLRFLIKIYYIVRGSHVNVSSDKLTSTVTD